MKRIILVFFLTGCSIPVYVRNTPARPVPVAGMGVVEVQGRNDQGQVVTTAIHKLNPSLGEVPTKEDYESDQGNFWGTAVTALTKAATGDYMGAILGVTAAVAGGGAAVAQKRKRSKEGVAHRARESKLAAMDPETAAQAINLQGDGDV